MPLVAIVTPVYRESLAPDECPAVRHLRTHLSGYDCYQLSPPSLKFRIEGLRFKPLENHWFTGVDAYSKLLLSAEFYQAFADYEFILIYQLDCLVFSDRLREWCQRDYDYVGAPLFKLKDDPTSGFSGACNGGLSLRKTGSFLRVLNSRRYVDEPAPFLKDVLHQPFVEVRPLPFWQRLKKRVAVARSVRQGVATYAQGYSLNEDHFWSGRASYFDPDFRVAPPEVALSFAFEAAPAWAFERNGRQLPFGAHAWQKYDRTFWEPHLLP